MGVKFNYYKGGAIMLKWIERLIESIAVENEKQFHGRRLSCYEINNIMRTDACKKSSKCMGLR